MMMRPPTHAPLPVDAVLQLLSAVRAAAVDGRLSLSAAERVAQEQGAQVSHVLVTAAMGGVQLEGQEPHVAEVCVAGCQAYGALDCLDALVKLRGERLAEGRAGFHVRATGCMNGCMEGPMCRVLTPQGPGFVPRASGEQLREGLAELLDAEATAP